MSFKEVIINAGAPRDLRHLLSSLHIDHQQSLELCWAIRGRKLPLKELKITPTGIKAMNWPSILR